MPATRTSALNQSQNGVALALTVSFLSLFLAGIPNNLHADDSASTNSMPVPGAQGTPVKETFVEENLSGTSSEEKKSGKVSRAIFTSQISDREPTDDLTEMSNTSDRIYFFTDLRDLEGQIITHRWEYKDKVMAEIKFKVGGGPRWRVYSSKNLLPEWVGVWTVVVTDENERNLDTSAFNYTQAVRADKPVTSPDAAPDATMKQKPEMHAPE